MTIKDAMEEIFGPLATCTHQVIRNGTGVEITIGNMYESPEINLDTLMKVGTLFGTMEVDVDNYAYCGCDTCDYGSDYGHTLTITNVAKSWDMIYGPGGGK
jgi:hypothetical protein